MVDRKPLIEERRPPGKNKRPRPFALEYRSRYWWHTGNFSEWSTWGKYRTERERAEALRNLSRKRDPHLEFRIPA